jgi:hypothetical protein
MAFDIIGRRPSTKQGEYFRRRGMWWAPLAVYMCRVAPEITGQCESWQTNAKAHYRARKREPKRCH